jgi:tetratricopeptide (TPR) repeat protein
LRPVTHSRRALGAPCELAEALPMDQRARVKNFSRELSLAVLQGIVYDARPHRARRETSLQILLSVSAKSLTVANADVFTFAIIVVLLWQALTEKTIAIAPIAVPRMLAENGYTADVAAQRLHDALNKFVKDARTSKQGSEVALQADLPSIVVPTIGLSLETVAADIRTFVQIPGRWNISGEFTIAQRPLRLRLRMNGKDLSTSANGVDPERADDLLAPAAEKVFELADPYIAAVSLYRRDPGKSLEIARRIIADVPETDPIAPWTHYLVGIILDDEHKTEEAIAEYRNAIELDPRLAAPHTNLGNALRDQPKTEDAIAEYRKAISSILAMRGPITI